MAGRLRAKQIPTLRPGRHGDGGTLFLVVEPSARSRHWVQRLTVNGKRRDLGLGGYPYVGLAEARAAAFALQAAEWRIPEERMKGGCEHRVPLSAAAMDTLERARKLHSPAGWCFPTPTRASKQMHATSLAHVVRTIYEGRCTVHGFRSSFRDWASEQTSVPHAVAEAALAHQVGSDVERSYARSDLFDKRRGLMDRWAEFVTSPMS